MILAHIIVSSIFVTSNFLVIWLSIVVSLYLCLCFFNFQELAKMGWATEEVICWNRKKSFFEVLTITISIYLFS